jgi:hypothetical protein
MPLAFNSSECEKILTLLWQVFGRRAAEGQAAPWTDEVRQGRSEDLSPDAEARSGGRRCQWAPSPPSSRRRSERAGLQVERPRTSGFVSRSSPNATRLPSAVWQIGRVILLPTLTLAALSLVTIRQRIAGELETGGCEAPTWHSRGPWQCLRAGHGAGTIRFKATLFVLANALTQHPVGLEETDDAVWSLSLGAVLLGKIDERTMAVHG